MKPELLVLSQPQLPGRVTKGDHGQWPEDVGKRAMDVEPGDPGAVPGPSLMTEAVSQQVR